MNPTQPTSSSPSNASLRAPDSQSVRSSLAVLDHLDLVLPSQWMDLRGEHVRGPVMDFWGEMLAQALIDLGLIAKRPVILTSYWRSARQWIASDDIHPSSFLRVCDILRLDPDGVRGRLRRATCPHCGDGIWLAPCRCVRSDSEQQRMDREATKARRRGVSSPPPAELPESSLRESPAAGSPLHPSSPTSP